VLADPSGGNPELILIASGSELSLAVEAHTKLLAEGIRSRVVSMPSWEIFDRQTQEYRDSVLPPAVKARVAVEQASTFGWERYVGSGGCVIGMKTFGASAPLKALQEKFGFELIPNHFTSLIQASAMYWGPQSHRIRRPRATSFAKRPNTWRRRTSTSHPPRCRTASRRCPRSRPGAWW